MPEVATLADEIGRAVQRLHRGEPVTEWQPDLEPGQPVAIFRLSRPGEYRIGTGDFVMNRHDGHRLLYVTIPDAVPTGSLTALLWAPADSVLWPWVGPAVGQRVIVRHCGTSRCGNDRPERGHSGHAGVITEIAPDGVPGVALAAGSACHPYHWIVLPPQPEVDHAEAV